MLEFAHGETSQSFTVDIVDNNKDQESFTTFNVILSNPGGGAVLSKKNIADVSFKIYLTLHVCQLLSTVVHVI